MHCLALIIIILAIDILSVDDLMASLSVQGFRDRIDVLNLFFVFESVVLCVAEIVVY